MPRTVNVYPKAVLEGSTWTLYCDVDAYEYETDPEDGASRHTHSGQLRILKWSFGIEIGDADTNLDVFTAFTQDDIKAGAQTETFWGNWVERADAVLDGLTPPFTQAAFDAEWTQPELAKTRSDGASVLSGRGWSLIWWHQHEPAGAPTDG